MSNNSVYATIVADLPPQMVSYSEKNTKEFKKKCMDALEEVGRSQYMENISLIENYEMVKGKFIYNHYFETEGYTDYIAQLTREFELPSYLRHYDIVSQVINTLSGEYQKRPDTFRVKNFSEQATNEYQRSKTELITKYVNSQIEAEVTRKLLESGLDPNKQDFQSEEEAGQYQQLLQESQKALTPPEIQNYMDTQWSQAAEIWATHQLELDKHRFQLPEKEKKEFEDMLISDRCFRHFYLTADGYNQETWNPVQVFFQKSPDVDYIEDGDYVGRLYYASIPTIIDKFGFLMTKKELEALENKSLRNDKTRWNYSKGSEYVFKDYMVPFEGFQVYDTIQKTVPQLSSDTLADLTSSKFFDDKPGLYRVTEAYWKTQDKIGKVTYIDPETGILTKQYVDENFVIPSHFKQLDSAFFGDTDEIDTVIWTWVNRVWKGIKINIKGTNNDEDLYLNVGPVDFQFKGDINPYNAKLPVVGQVFSIRNSKPMSLVDLMKPYQIFYNVAMNQLYQIAEREIGNFIVMDVNLFPNSKDWGGEKSWEKYMLIARQLGIAPADTSRSNTTDAQVSGGQYPKLINMDESARMISRMTLAEKFEQMALRQVGFNEYRLGSYGQNATAGGVEQGTQASYAQTESHFTNFSNYLRRCHEFDLNIAQYTQSRQKDITVMNVKSDMSRTFIKVLGTDLLMADLHVRVINSQEFIRQLEMLRQLALQNNTTDASMTDLTSIILASSPSEIKILMKEADKRKENMAAQRSQMEQEQIAQQNEQAMLAVQKADEQFQEKLQNNLDVAYIQAGANLIGQDGNNGEADSRALDMKENERSDKRSYEQQKLEVTKQKNISDSNINNRKLALDQAKINKDLQVAKDKIRVMEVMKGKESKQNKK